MANKTVKTTKLAKVMSKPHGGSPKTAKLAPTAKIVILAAGRENPRRAKSAAHRRYAALLKSRTVGAFLAKHPGWTSTVRRAASEKLVRVG